MYLGRAFYNLGATTLKALDPIVTRRNLGVTNNPSLEDLKESKVEVNHINKLDQGYGELYALPFGNLLFE